MDLTRSKTLNYTICAILGTLSIVIGFIIGFNLEAIIVYAITYSIYHESYDMNTGCPKNGECAFPGKLMCYYDDFIICGIWGVVVTIGCVVLFVCIIPTLVQIYLEFGSSQKNEADVFEQNDIIIPNVLDDGN